MATIQKRGKSYRIRAYAGYDIEGKQIERTTTWCPPAGMTDRQAEKEAMRQAVLFEEKIRNGEACNGRIRFAGFAEQWLSAYARPQLRLRTVARYEELLLRINAAIGHMPLEKIRPTHILEFYKSLSESEPANASYQCTVDLKSLLKDKQLTKAAFSTLSSVSLTTLGTCFQKKSISRSSAEKISNALGVTLSTLFRPSDPQKVLSSSTVQRYHSLVCKILNDAVHWQLIPYNPCTRIAAPKSSAPEISYLDDEDAKALLKLLRTLPSHYRRAYALEMLTGLRRGELLGLEWSDIDWEQKSMRICRTSQYLPGHGVFTDITKNRSSQRIVMISDQIIRLLQEQYHWQQLQKKTLGDAWKESGRVITMPNGQPMRPDHFSSQFKKFVKDFGVPDVHLHSLRHTYATLCIAKGEALTAVAEQLGHANIATTAKIYAHAIKSAQISATNTIGDLFDEDL